MTYQVLARRLRYQVAGDELSSTEGAVLGHLRRGGPMTPGQLARAEYVRPPSMTRVIENLERRNLVRREPHPTACSFRSGSRRWEIHIPRAL